MQSIEEFDVNKWEATCRKYDRNRLGLKFDIEFSIQDGKMKIEFTNLEDKYFKPVKNIAIECAKGAVIFLNQQFLPTYVINEENAYDVEYEKSMNTLKMNTEYFLSVLLQSGFDEFIMAVDQQISLLQLQYCITHISLKHGEWKLASGEVWNGHGWEKNGTTYHYPLLQSVCDTLFLQSSEEKTA